MARPTSIKPAAQESALNMTVLAQDTAAMNQLAVMELDAQSNAQAMALQLGYEGTLTVGALEDEIRFYQRRTVEACLELGKRLLLLKEITPHGEFESRIGLLGFAERTAQRFMLASAKTVKSANLALLSTQVKSVSAFLELVTQDDDALQKISEMDGIDCLSASELKAKLREANNEIDNQKKLNETKAERIQAQQDELDRKALRQPDEVLIELQKLLGEVSGQAQGVVQGPMRKAYKAVLAHHESFGGSSKNVMAGYVNELQNIVNGLRDDFMLNDSVGDGTPAWKQWAAEQDNGMVQA